MKKSLGAKPIAFPAPVWCIGAYDESGKPNVMTAAWGGICCSKPPCLTVSLRKATYTYSCLARRMAYTVSVPSAAFAAQADYFGMVSGRDADKFQATGLTPTRAQHVDAPFVAEFPMVIECEVVHSYEIGLHTHFVGEIKDVLVEEALLNQEGKPDMAKVAPLVFAPDARDYFSVGTKVGDAFSMGKPLLG